MSKFFPSSFLILVSSSSEVFCLANIIFQFVGGLRYSFGYCGARNIAELHEKAEFVRVSAAGLREAHPHDVTMLKDAPNYSSGH